MKTEWFYDSNGRPVGPYTKGELKRLYSKGVITKDTLIIDRYNMQRFEEYGKLFPNEVMPPLPTSDPTSNSTSAPDPIPIKSFLDKMIDTDSGILKLSLYELVIVILNVFCFFLLFLDFYKLQAPFIEGINGSLKLIDLIKEMNFIEEYFYVFILLIPFISVIFSLITSFGSQQQHVLGFALSCITFGILVILAIVGINIITIAAGGDSHWAMMVDISLTFSAMLAIFLSFITMVMNGYLFKNGK